MNPTMRIGSKETGFTQFVGLHPSDESSEVEDASLGRESCYAVRLGKPCMRLLKALLPDLDDDACSK